MNDQTLTPVQPTRAAGRLFAVAALGALMFGAVGCTVPGSNGPDASQSAPAETKPGASGAASESSASGGDSGTAGSGTSGSGAAGSGTQSARDVVEKAPASSSAEALAAAQKLFAGEPTKIALDHRRDGTLEYDVELVSSTEVYEVELNADTLAVLAEDREPIEPGDDDQRDAFDFAKVIDVAEAAATARQAQPGQIQEWTLESEGGGLVTYEFDVVPPGQTGGTGTDADDADDADTVDADTADADADADADVRVNALTGDLLPGD